MSLKDRIEEWYINAYVGTWLPSHITPLTVTQEELFFAIKHYSRSPLIHRQGKTILRIDGFDVYFHVLNIEDYFNEAQKL